MSSIHPPQRYPRQPQTNRSRDHKQRPHERLMSRGNRDLRVEYDPSPADVEVGVEPSEVGDEDLGLVRNVSVSLRTFVEIRRREKMLSEVIWWN